MGGTQEGTNAERSERFGTFAAGIKLVAAQERDSLRAVPFGNFLAESVIDILADQAASGITSGGAKSILISLDWPKSIVIF